MKTFNNLKNSLLNVFKKRLTVYYYASPTMAYAFLEEARISPSCLQCRDDRAKEECLPVYSLRTRNVESMT